MAISIGKKCLECSKEFVSKNKKGVYCGESCKNKAWSKKYRGKNNNNTNEGTDLEDTFYVPESPHIPLVASSIIPEEISGYPVRSFYTNKEGEPGGVWRRKDTEYIVFDKEAKEFIKANFKDVVPFTFVVNSKPRALKSHIFWLSDLHCGMTNVTPQFGSRWSLPLMEERILQIPKYVNDCDELIIANIGDSVDGMDKFTVSRKHQLDQDLNNWEQILGAFRVFQKLFSVLAELQKQGVFNKLRWVSVGESNHSGYMDRAISEILSDWLLVKFPSVDVYTAQNYIDKFSSHGHNFVFCHGKDNKHQKFGFPLMLDAKTENYFRQIFEEMNIPADKFTHVVSGHTHQESLNRRRFTYEKVMAISTGSDHGQTNYGFQDSGISYSKIYDDVVERGAIIFEKNSSKTI